MTLEAWGWLMIGVGVGWMLYAWMNAREVQADSDLADWLRRDRDAALDDHHLTVFERLPLYDWNEGGDL